jgi:hypothetical protein
MNKKIEDILTDEYIEMKVSRMKRENEDRIKKMDEQLLKLSVYYVVVSVLFYLSGAFLILRLLLFFLK